MASASSINTTNTTTGPISHHHGHHHPPNPPPRTHSRPNQPPPPPPLPSVPPVPPTRDSSIALSKSAIGHPRHNEVAAAASSTTIPPPSIIASNLSPALPAAASPNVAQGIIADGSNSFLSPFMALFKPLHELPLPEPFMNKPKTYPSQRAQQRQSSNNGGT